jgi:hypothetical protein
VDEDKSIKDERKRKVRAAVGSKWALYGATILLLIASLFGAYYFLYTSDRAVLLDQYYLRLLSNSAGNVQDIVEGRRTNVSIATRGFRNSVKELEAIDVAKTTLIENLKAIESLSVDEAASKKFLNELFLSIGPQPADASTDDSDVPYEASEESPTADTLELDLSVDGLETLEYEVASSLRQDDGAAVLEFRPTLVQDGSAFTLAVARVEMQQMIAPALPGEVFGTVLLARAGGQVLFQSGHSQYRMRELPETSRRASKTGATILDPDPSSRTHIRRVEIAGVEYKLFVQPFRVPIDVDNEIDDDAQVDGDDDEHYWVLAGLMPVADLRTEAMIISPNLVLLVVGLFVAGMLSLPYLKIRFLGHREALRAQDVLVLAVAILVGTSLYTYALVDSFVYGHLTGVRGEQLEALAKGIQRETLNELSRAGEQLEALTHDRSNELAKTPDAPWAKGRLFADRDLPPYPYFQMAFWLDDGGLQVGKWGPAENITAKIRVATRDYFRHPHVGDLWTLEADAPPPANDDAAKSEAVLADGVFVQSIRSKTTGDVSAVLGRKFVKAGADDRAVVAAIETHLLTLIDPVLPAGFAYAVFDDDGKVLFHSDKARNLHENFLDEVEDDDRLRAAVFSGADERVLTTYRTRPVEVFVTKMDSLPWHLAVMADADRLRTRHLEALTFALMLFTLYLVVVLLMGVWLRFADRVRPSPGAVRSNWFWPDPRKVFPYSVVTFSMGWLLVCWAGGTVLGDPIKDIGRTIFTAVVGMTLVHWVLRTHHVSELGLRQWWTSLRIAAATAVLGFLVVADEQRPEILAFLGDWRLSAEALLGFALVAVLVFRRAGPLLGLLSVIAIGMALGSEDDAGNLWTGIGVLSLIFLVLGIPWPKLKRPTETLIYRSGAGWKGVYVACAFSVMLVLGALPAIAFYRVTHNDVSFLFAKHDQIEFADALRARTDQLAERYATLNTRDPLPILQAGEGDLGRQLHVYAGQDYESEAGVPWLAATEDPPAEDWVDSAPSRQVLVKQLRSFLPQYNETTFRLRDLFAEELDTDASSTRTWTYASSATTPGEGRLRMVQTNYRSALDLGLAWHTAARPPESAVDLELASPIATLDRTFVAEAVSGAEGGYVLWAVGCAFALMVLWFVLTSSVQRVFLINTVHPRVLRKSLGEGARARARSLVLQPDEETAKKLADPATCWVIDSKPIREAETTRELVDAAVESKRPTIVVRRFDDGLDEPELARKKLTLLEELHQVGDQNVVVTAAVDPLHYFTARANDSMASTLVLDVDRWAAVLEPFEKIRGDAHEKTPQARREDYLTNLKKAVPGLPLVIAEVLAAECWASPYQRMLGKRMAPRIDYLDRDQIVDLVLDHSEAYYRRLWSSCSTEERLLLNRLAQEGFVNWQMDESLRRMLRRGIVVATPAYRLMNESFRRFVLRAETHTVFAMWEMQGDQGLFARLKVPLVTALIVLAGFFFATQRESFNHTLGIVTAMATSGPLLVKLMTATAAARQKG